MAHRKKDATPTPFASRAGEKLQAALIAFDVDPTGLCCADLGCNVGGFTDCLLRNGASKVYAVDTGYGALAWKLRKDDRVVVMERSNALHTALPEPVSLITIDVAWTRQHHIIPAAHRMLEPGGSIISLIKPHYEAERSQLQKGVLPPEDVASTLSEVAQRLKQAGFVAVNTIRSPILGRKGNEEHLAIFKFNS